MSGLLSSQRHQHADFLDSLAHRIRNYSVDSNQRQSESQDCEASQQQQVGAPRAQ